MDTLDSRYLKILHFLEKYEHTYDTDTICYNLRCERADIIYLVDKLHYVKWHSYDVPSLDAEGRNFLARLRESQKDKYATTEDARKTRRIAVWAIIISALVGLGEIAILILLSP